MRSRNALLLGVAALAVLAAALLLSNPHSSSVSKLPETLYPTLKDDLGKVTSVRIFKAGDARAVELTQADKQWTLSERSNYPADASKVRKLLLSLAQAKLVEEKTSNPENYPALGVEDIAGAAATGARVELVGTTQPVNLIVGKAAGVKGTYVRRTGEPASWLVNETIEASTTPHDWLTTAIVDVGADRMQSATIAIAGVPPYTVAKNARADADFRIDGLPKGKEPDGFAANNVASALTALTLADVHPAQDFAAQKPVAHATFKTFDGLVVDLDGWTKDGKHYVAAKTSYDEALAARFHVDTKAPQSSADPKSEGAIAKPAEPPSAEKIDEAAKVTNQRVQGWVYEIPDYKYEAIFKPALALAKK